MIRSLKKLASAKQAALVRRRARRVRQLQAAAPGGSEEGSSSGDDSAHAEAELESGGYLGLKEAEVAPRRPDIPALLRALCAEHSGEQEIGVVAAGAAPCAGHTSPSLAAMFILLQVSRRPCCGHCAVKGGCMRHLGRADPKRVPLSRKPQWQRAGHAPKHRLLRLPSVTLAPGLMGPLPSAYPGLEGMVYAVGAACHAHNDIGFNK